MADFVMEAAAAWLEARQNGFGNGNGNGNQQMPKFNGSIPLTQAGTNGTVTDKMALNRFRLDAALSIRNSTIILASFNAIAGFATAMALILESFMRKRRNQREFPTTRLQLPFFQLTDIYPFILSLGIMIQGISFAVVQAQGLKGIFARGCSLIAQFMLPAVFIVPYIQLVFGLEVAMRGLGKKPFSQQKRFSLTGCLVIVGALLLTNFLVAKFNKPQDFCFASLFYFIAHYAVGCFAVLLVIIILHLLSIMVIFLRLRSGTGIENDQRIVASRMIYFLVLATLTTVIILPFFYSMAFTEQDDDNNNTLQLSMVASVAADLTGLTTGGLVLLFRSNLISTIGPRDKAGEYDKQKIKHQIQHFDPDNQNNGGGSNSVPRSPKDLADLRRMLSDANVMGDDDSDDDMTLADRKSYEAKSSPKRPNPLRSNAIYPMDTDSLRAPEAALAPKKDRKSILSTITSATIRIAKPISLLPATVYNPQATKTATKPDRDLSALKPPPALNKFGFRHRRDSSMVSTATVQIGLRLSNFEDMIAPAAVHDPTVHSLDCPKVLAAKGMNGDTKRPSPLFAVDNSSPTTENKPEEDERERDDRTKTLPRLAVQAASPPQPTYAPVELPAAAIVRPVVAELPSPRPAIEMDAMPPKPQRAPQPAPEPKRESGGAGSMQTLSPTIYNPNNPMSPRVMRTPSPRGVGFTIPSPLPRSASSAGTGPKSPNTAIPARSPSAPGRFPRVPPGTTAAAARGSDSKSPTAGSPTRSPSARSPPPRRTTGEPKMQGSDKPGQWI